MLHAQWQSLSALVAAVGGTVPPYSKRVSLSTSGIFCLANSDSLQQPNESEFLQGTLY